MTAEKKGIQLSASALSILADCKRCFYLDRKMKAPRPRGIFPSLPGGVDGILKARLDSFRGSLPPELECEQLNGWRLFEDAETLAGYRQWNSKGALKYTDKKGNVLVGGLDDLLEVGVSPISDDTFAPLDYKTKGSEPTQEDCEKYYQRQLDIYALLIDTKYPGQVAEFGCLLYFWPVQDKENLVKFESKPFFMDVSKDRAIALFNEALELLEANELPDASPECSYCKAHAVRSEAMLKSMAGGK